MALVCVDGRADRCAGTFYPFLSAVSFLFSFSFFFPTCVRGERETTGAGSASSPWAVPPHLPDSHCYHSRVNIKTKNNMWRKSMHAYQYIYTYANERSRKGEERQVL